MAVILHIEDEHSVRFLYKEVFEELGHKVIPATSGEEGLRVLKASRPDIIILDLKMPGMGGKAFLERFHRLKLRIPVVISTAYPYLDSDPALGGADAYIVKSGDLTDLVETVGNLLTKSSRA
jgi:CheY-like chemotaxis protein